MQTITERYGRRRLTIFFVCAFTVIGVVGFMRINLGYDGPPSCAKSFVGTYDGPGGVALGEHMNKLIECDKSVEKWCAKRHPDAADDCANSVELDGDDRNIGKK